MTLNPNTLAAALMQHPVLFTNPNIQKPKYWTCIWMVATPGQEMPAGGWTQRNCVALYCTKCNLQIPYIIGNSKNYKQHMLNAHPKDVAAEIERQNAAKEGSRKRVATVSPTNRPPRERSSHGRWPAPARRGSVRDT